MATANGVPSNSLHASDFGLTGGTGVTGQATDDNTTPLNTYLRAK